DPRFPSLHKNRRQVLSAWCQREFRNLLKAREAGVRVPTPFAASNNVLVMEFIGDETAAQKLHTEPSKTPKAFYDEVVKNMRLLNNAGLVHGDLSQFNILNYNNEPVLIDFSQTTTRENPNFEEYLERDIKNVSAYFAKQGVKVTQESLRKLIVRN
ncbi:MAG: RIO1 family regulatory kinase/ATPase, partial [Candidatus Woesearchaeota archaeon]|nr:RIO1 family regulatory kinase/ATPase [Candidatus Woesearchaeota archaeon]